MKDSKRAARRIARGVSIPALLISIVGLFVPFFSVYHRSLNIWQVHHGCSLVSAALSQGPTTMTILMPPLFGSIHRTCPTMAIAWPVFVGLGLFGVVAGAVALLWQYGRTRTA